MAQGSGRGWVRVIAGSHRGLRLATLPGRDLRPTSDRVRESLFGVLGDRVRKASVWDCFAGTGALGIEALSRGADRVLFVEREPRAVALLRENLARLPGDPVVRVVPGDALAPVDWGRPDYPAEVVLADPPYRQGWGDRFLAALRGSPALNPEALIVLEHEEEAAPSAPGWAVVDRRRYGDTALSFYAARESGRSEESA